ncbi:MAG TPA: HNH endonuclease [Enteractinococcus helveticum]|uniref:HNH endonuclease n=1 Tax=Enteractinococcus helveticum TaxID=1837282 RepID=A0A921FMG5_9MICC|nr:HNH endonuclease signature motif containing protein [Enteractinococcus helveticum]HJF14530.1 HNH endonuclease [Enteractinococcus helveticum]
MTATQPSTGTTVANPVDWAALSTDEIHAVLRGAYTELEAREQDAPTDGILHRSIQLEETLRMAAPLQYRYAGLLQDAFNNEKLRDCVNLPKGKTPFRDATDFLAKTHGLRANEAAARLRLAASLTPVRATDEQRTDDVGHTHLPILSQFKGQVHPSKLSSALSMLAEVDKHAQAAGKDETFRAKLRRVAEKDLAEKIERTTPEEFSRYVTQRKKDLLASLDPPDGNFTQAQTEAMYDVRRTGPVRGNKNAIGYEMVVDAECDEILQTYLMGRTNPRGKDDADTDFETRSRGHRKMVALRDALKFVTANLDKTGFRGASGAHTQMLVIIDYPTLLDGLRKDLGDRLPEISAAQRENLLALLAQAHHETSSDNATAQLPLGTVTADDAPAPETHSPHESIMKQLGENVLSLPPPKTTNIEEIIDDDNLDRLQPRISQGVYNPDIPPDVLLRMHCDIGITPITLTGDRQILSVGTLTRQFPEHVRRAIKARDRGCAVPGCHVPVALCEIHHATPWAKGGVTSTDNGVMLCSHHHAAVHAQALKIVRVDGEFRFVLHPMIDADQRPRVNYFFQA